MKAIRNKLISRRGASITFALLLFLVCAAVGGVVLAAGTAAGGRVSEMAEMDQRYYSVTSAAELIANELNGKTVTIERKKVLDIVVTEEWSRSWVEPSDDDETAVGSWVWEQDDTNTAFKATYSTNINSVPETSQPADVVCTPQPVPGDQSAVTSYYPVSTEESTVSTNDMSFLTELAARMLFTDDVGNLICNTETAMGKTLSPISWEPQFKLQFDDSHKSLDIVGSAKLDSTGSKLLITIQNNDPDDVYSLLLTFTLNPRDTDETSGLVYTGADSYYPSDNTCYDRDYYTWTRNRVSEITCTLESIQKGGEAG